MQRFTKENDKKLISLVKSKPFLYKPSVPGYKDQLAKSLAWEEISDKLGIPLPAIRRRWKHIKEQCRKNARAEVQNNIDSKFNDTKIDLRDHMYKKKINGEWCMILLPPPKEDHDDEVDETEDLGLKQENNTTINNYFKKSYFSDDTDDTTDLSDTEYRKYVNVSKYQKNGIVIENLDTRKGLATSDSFNTLDRKRKKIMDELKQKHGRGTKVDKIITQHMETLKIENEIDGIQNLNGKKRKIMSNKHEEYHTKLECDGKIDSDNININSSDIMDILRHKLGLCLTKMKIYREILSIGDPERSPMHKFFEEAASIVTMFPPDLACETSLMIYREIIEKEMY